MSSSENMKQGLIKEIESVFGKNFKTPLAKELGVHVTTVRRVFNQRKVIPPLYVKAIREILIEKNSD